jgi:hypothetical protein
VEHFAGEAHATRTCPRRHLLRNPDLAAVFELRGDLGEAGLGLEGPEHLTVAAVEALGVVDDGVAYRTRVRREGEFEAAAVVAALQAMKEEGEIDGG